MGHEVVCTTTYMLGQDALETVQTSVNGAPQVQVALFANATATQDDLSVSATAATALSVSQVASLDLSIVAAQCAAPQEPGEAAAGMHVNWLCHPLVWH